jgi:hypothetical protein
MFLNSFFTKQLKEKNMLGVILFVSLFALVFFALQQEGNL